MSNTFKALRAELESEELTIKITELELEDLPDGDTTIEVHYSSLNYKDGILFCFCKDIPPSTVNASSLVEVLIPK